MAISYAGTNLLCSIPEIDAWVEANLSLKDLLNDWRLYFPSAFTTNFRWPGWIDERRVRVGSLFWPSHMSRWAIGNFLATEAQVDAITALTYPTSGGMTAKTLSMTWVDDTNSSTVASITPSLFLLPPRKLSAIAPTTPEEQLFLLTLVDERFFLWGISTGTLPVTDQTTTWSTLFTSLASALGISITLDSVNAAYLNVPGAFGVSQEYASVITDGASYSVGQKIARSLTGTYRSWGSANAAAQVTTNLALTTANKQIAGGAFSASDTKATTPANVKIIFPGTTKTAAVSSTGHSYVPEYHHSCASTPSNSTALQTLATQLGTDLLIWLQPIEDSKWAGIVPFTPEPLHDLEWTYRFVRTSLDLPEDQIEMDPTYPKELGELDDEAAWYDAEVTTRMMPSPYLDFFLPVRPGTAVQLSGCGRIRAAVPSTTSSGPTNPSYIYYISGNPSSPINGQIWINSSGCLLTYQCGGSSYVVPQGTGTQYYTTVWTGTNTFGSVSPGTAGYVLTSNGASAYPTYQAPAGGTGSAQAYNLSGNSVDFASASPIFNYSGITDGFFGILAIKNDGGTGHDLSYVLTATDMYGNTGTASGTVNDGSYTNQELWGAGGNFTGSHGPFKTLSLLVYSAVNGASTHYQVYAKIVG